MTNIGLLWKLLAYLLGYTADKPTDCNIGNKLITSIDMDKYLGTWHSLYHTRNVEAYTCFNDTYEKTDSGYLIKSEFFHKGKTENHQGTANIQGNAIIVKYENYDDFSGLFQILDINDEKYAVIAACPPGLNEVLLLLAFKDPDPDAETLELAKEALKRTGHEWNELIKAC